MTAKDLVDKLGDAVTIAEDKATVDIAKAVTALGAAAEEVPYEVFRRDVTRAIRGVYPGVSSFHFRGAKGPKGEGAGPSGGAGAADPDVVVR